MALDEYSKKRNFRKTAEPPARQGKSHARTIFVVQKHAASHDCTTTSASKSTAS